MDILLIGPEFHNYCEEMVNELERNGHKVVFSTLSFRLSAIDRIRRKLSPTFLKKKYLKILKKEIGRYKHVDFDRVVLIYGGDAFSDECLRELRLVFKKALFIFYNWDSVCYNKNSLTYYKLFDKYYSFDFGDCERYGFERLDNWYSYKMEPNPKPKYNYGCLMVLTGSKITGYLKIKSALPTGCHGIEYLVMPNKTYYLFQQIFNHKKFSQIDKDFIYARPLPLKKAMDFYNDCFAVIDIPMENQNGVTTRVFEALSQGKKIITTSQIIKKYDFYSPNNIFVINDENNKVPLVFFSTPFDEKFKAGGEYSLNSFVRKLFQLEGENYAKTDDRSAGI